MNRAPIRANDNRSENSGGDRSDTPGTDETRLLLESGIGGTEAGPGGNESTAANLGLPVAIRPHRWPLRTASGSNLRSAKSKVIQRGGARAGAGRKPKMFKGLEKTVAEALFSAELLCHLPESEPAEITDKLMCDGCSLS